MTDIAIATSKSNRIRAIAAADPDASPEAIARRLGIRPVEVRNALRRQPSRRRKSVAS